MIAVTDPARPGRISRGDLQHGAAAPTPAPHRSRMTERIIPAPRSALRAPRSVLPAPCSPLRAPRSVLPAPRSAPPGPGSRPWSRLLAYRRRFARFARHRCQSLAADGRRTKDLGKKAAYWLLNFRDRTIFRDKFWPDPANRTCRAPDTGAAPPNAARQA